MQASSLDAFVVPSDMSTAEQISKDEQHSAETLRTLDRIMGIPANLTQAVLNYTGSPEAKLDLHVLYLRSVHNFCFYSSAWCDDEWDLRERCGPALVRDNAANLPTSSQHSTGQQCTTTVFENLLHGPIMKDQRDWLDTRRKFVPAMMLYVQRRHTSLEKESLSVYFAGASSEVPTLSRSTSPECMLMFLSQFCAQRGRKLLSLSIWQIQTALWFFLIEVTQHMQTG